MNLLKRNTQLLLLVKISVCKDWAEASQIRVDLAYDMETAATFVMSVLVNQFLHVRNMREFYMCYLVFM